MPYFLKDLLDLSSQISLTVLMLALAWFAFHRAKAAPGGQGWLDKVLRMDRQKQMLVLTGVCLLLAFATNLAMIWMVIQRGVTDPVVVALVGNFNGAVTTACIGTPIAYWFGSSNGSQLKDEKGAPKPTGDQQ